MNDLVIIQTSQGLAHYLLECDPLVRYLETAFWLLVVAIVHHYTFLPQRHKITNFILAR